MTDLDQTIQDLEEDLSRSQDIETSVLKSDLRLVLSALAIARKALDEIAADAKGNPC